jgi:ribosomal protein S17E
MSSCIFCEEENPEDALECFNCSKKPFPGMYIEDGFFDRIDELVKSGDVDSACEKLLEEYENHTDVDYYDDETAMKIAEIINNIFERYPETFKHRFELSIIVIQRGAFWQYPVHDEFNLASKIISEQSDEKMKHRLTEAIDNYNH